MNAIQVEACLEEVSATSKEQHVFKEAIARYRTRPTFDNEGINGWVYDNQFAGVWYDKNGKLNIGVKIADFEGTMTSRAMKITRNPAVVYVQRRFSYNFLNKIHHEVGNLMPKLSIVSVAMTPQYNQVEIGLTNADYIRVITEYLYKLYIYKTGAINFVIEERGYQTRLMSRPIHAGDRIQPPRHQIDKDRGITHFGTLSAKAVCNRTGRRGIITNAHVARRIDEHISLGSHRIGRRNPPGSGRGVLGGNVDAAFIPFDSPNNWQFTSSARPRGEPNYIRTHKIDFRDEIVVGAAVEKFGSVTGRTSSTISAVRERRVVRDSPDSPRYYVGISRTFTDQFRFNVNSRQGDSGAPVYIVRGNRRYLAGVFFAATGYYYHDEITDEIVFHGIISSANKITNVTRALDVTIMSESLDVNRLFDVGRHRIANNNYFYGEDEFYFINRVIGFSANAYINIPNLLRVLPALNRTGVLTSAMFIAVFTSNRNTVNLRANILDAASPSEMSNARVMIRYYEITQSTTGSVGAVFIDLMPHLVHGRDRERGVGIISLWNAFNPVWDCGHRVTFISPMLALGFG